MDAQMKKGVLEMCVLHLLSGEPVYGYEVMKSVQDVLPNVYDGSVYAILRRLHSDGCTETFSVESSGGPPRKYYTLTAIGRNRLDDALKEWRSVVDAVNKLGLL